MAGVMYQGYASYLQAYQRSPYCPPSATLPLNHYDKKYRLQDVGVVGAAGGSSQPPTPDLQATPQHPQAQQQAQQQQTQQYPAAVASSSTSTTPQLPPNPVSASAASASTAAAAAAASHSAVCSSPVASQQQQAQQAQQAQQTAAHTAKTDEKSDDPPRHADAHYISANCVVLTYFSGDLATAVDEHFSRALTQSFSKSSKDPCPMSQRNLPASFWNSHYHAGVSGYGAAAAGGSMGLTGHEALYPDYSSLHSLHHQGDPWAYNFTGQYPHHRSVADFTYMPSSSRYPHNYSPLLMGRPRLPQCVVGKADPWSTAPRLHEEMTFDPAAYTHHFSSMSGLEGAGASQEGSKDLYWF